MIKRLRIEDDVEERIKVELNRFRDLVPDNGFGKPEWTAGVKNALRVVGHHFSYNVNTTIEEGLLPQQLREKYRRPEYGEWIYDLSIQEVKDNESWRNVVIAECEWDGWEDIKEDFEKLVVGRAQLRVMVYDSSYATANDFIGWINRHQDNRLEDTYLLVAYEGSAEKRLPLLFRRIVVRSVAGKMIAQLGDL